MKFRFLMAFFCFTFLSLNAQKLTLNDLENICNKSNWESVNQFLMHKNWEYYESSKGDSEKYNTITWSYNKSYEDKAEAWFYLYTYDEFPNKISYSVFNKAAYSTIQNVLSSKGYKLQESEIEDNELISTYANTKFIIKITTEKREKDDYSTFEKSITAYSFILIKKSGVYDPSNGKKTYYYNDSNQIKNEYFLKNGKFEGESKSYYENGQLKKVVNYKNDLANGTVLEFNEEGEKTYEFTMSNGVKNGLFKSYEQNRISYITSFKGDKQNGEKIDYFYDKESGRLHAKLITNYTNGIKEGLSKFLYVEEDNTERVLTKTKYSNGLKNGLVQDVQGDSLIFATYLDDKLNGSYRLYRDISKFLFGGVIKTDTTQLKRTDFGQYKNDKKTGYWKHYSIKGSLSEGNYSNSLKTGSWKYYYSPQIDKDNDEPLPYSEKLFLIENYSNGKLNGLSERFSNLSETTFKCNKLDQNGKVLDSCKTMVYKNIHELINYKNDELHGLYSLNDSIGMLRFKGNYNYGKEQGEWLESYTIDVENELLYVYRNGNYNEGEKEGKWIEYIDKNAILIEKNYKNNLLHGEYNLYSTGGLKKEKKTFNRGELQTLKVYDSIGRNIEKEYQITTDSHGELDVNYIIYFENGSKAAIEYTILKPDEDITHYNFRDVFHTQLEDNTKHYYNGNIIITNADGSLYQKGYMFKFSKVGDWEHYYHKQNIKIVTKYSDSKSEPDSETYYTIDTNQLFNGDFIFADSETEGTEERRIRDGLRNGNTTFFDKEGNKTKKEKYKDGLLKA